MCAVPPCTAGRPDPDLRPTPWPFVPRCPFSSVMGQALVIETRIFSVIKKTTQEKKNEGRTEADSPFTGRIWRLSNLSGLSLRRSVIIRNKINEDNSVSGPCIPSRKGKGLCFPSLNRLTRKAENERRETRTDFRDTKA